MVLGHCLEGRTCFSQFCKNFTGKLQVSFLGSWCMDSSQKLPRFFCLFVLVVRIMMIFKIMVSWRSLWIMKDSIRSSEILQWECNEGRKAIWHNGDTIRWINFQQEPPVDQKPTHWVDQQRCVKNILRWFCLKLFNTSVVFILLKAMYKCMKSIFLTPLTCRIDVMNG